jgi:hypothetical protein
MRTLLLAAALLLAIPSLARATAQAPEILLIDGKEHALRSTPLEGYLEKHPHKEIRIAGGGYSTALWRGYVATWEIKDDKLMLVKIEGFKDEWRAYPLEKVFPKQKGPILADWYTGLLSVPEGELLAYVHMGFESTFEKEQLFLIEKGVVKKKATIKNLDADPFTSVRDRRWVAVGDPPKEPGDAKDPGAGVPGAGDWLDARLLQTTAADAAIKAGKPIKTRGMLFEDTDDNGKVTGHVLYIPETRETHPLSISLGQFLIATAGRHAEVEGVLTRDKDNLSMKVQSTRALKYGETMHAPSLKDTLWKMDEKERAKVVWVKVEKE